MDSSHQICSLDEKQPVTPAMALRIGKLRGNGPDLWLNLQKRYDLWKAQRDIGAEIRLRLSGAARLSLASHRPGPSTARLQLRGLAQILIDP